MMVFVMYVVKMLHQLLFHGIKGSDSLGFYRNITEKIHAICNFAKSSVQLPMCAPLLGRFDYIG